MSYKRLAEYTSLCIPEMDDTILTPTCQRFAIRAERHTIDPVRMRCKQVKCLSTMGIIEPDPNRARNPQSPAIRGVRDCPYSTFTEAGFSTFRQMPLLQMLASRIIDVLIRIINATRRSSASGLRLNV